MINNSLTLPFPMETQKQNDDILKKHISDIVRHIFEKVASETPSNHTMVGKPQKINKKTITPSLYNPHNYRLYFNFTKEQYKPKEGMVGVWLGKIINYGSTFTSIGEGIRVTIRKTQVEVINKLTEEQWFLINRARAKEEIYAICNKIDDKCISSLKKFIEVYGGNSDFVILKRECRGLFNNLNTKSDNKVMQEPFIDKLPLDMTFETDIVKKVYKKPNVEFKEPIYAAKYLENSALNEFSPEISNAINQLDTRLTPVLAELTRQIELHLKVQERTLEYLQGINEGLAKKPTQKPKRMPYSWHKRLSPKLQSLINKKGKLII